MKDLLGEYYYSLEENSSALNIKCCKKAELFEKLLECLGEEEKALFTEYDEAMGEYFAEVCIEDFKRGYRHNLRHIFEMLLQD